MNSTRLYLPTMLAVLQQTSQNREFLNRLRAFGLGRLIDAYLTSIASSDGARVGGGAVEPFSLPEPLQTRGRIDIALVHRGESANKSRVLACLTLKLWHTRDPAFWMHADWPVFFLRNYVNRHSSDARKLL